MSMIAYEHLGENLSAVSANRARLRDLGSLEVPWS
jgi:hypothetical protein